MTIGEFSAYGYFILTISLSILFMGYVYHLYTAKKKGTKDYEKYGDLALHDDLTDAPIENMDEDSTIEESKEKMEG